MEEIIKKLNECFLPHNVECDGSYCTGCWKDVVREAIKMLDSSQAMCWVEFDRNKPKTHPTEYGKYLICRKDGKIHWETWNGSGWAYNHKEIVCWAKIASPLKFIQSS